MARVGKFIDTSKCTGCRGCQIACKQWNQLPAQIEAFRGSYQTHAATLARTYTIVQMQEQESAAGVEWHFRKHGCMHCAEATCIKVCPHKAPRRMAEGPIYRVSGCKGCSYCAVKCPFKVPKIADGRAWACWMCYSRISNGLKPACVSTCPAGALSYGVRDELVLQAQKRLAEVRVRYSEANLYGLNFLGGTGVFYLLLKAPSFYGLPLNPSVPAGSTWFGTANGTRTCFSCHDEETMTTITSPTEAETVAGTISACAYTDATATVSKVEFYLDGTLVGSDNSAPFTCSIDTTRYANGQHALKARAYSGSGSDDSKSTLFYINNSTTPPPSPPPAVDTTPPSVAFSAPKAGATVSRTLTVKVTATDNVGVAKVELFAKGALLATKTAAPFDFSVDLTKYPVGKLLLSATAYDSAGNSASTSITVKVA